MPRYKTMFLIAASLVMYPVLAIAAEDERMKALSMKDTEGCVSIGGYYIPQKLRDTVRSHLDDNLFIFEGKNFFEIMSAYSDNIKNNLEEAAKPNIKSIAIDNLLNCSKELNQSQEKVLSKWYTDNMLKNMNNPSPTTQFIENIYNGYSTFICKQYNEIALLYERKSMLNTAEDIYRNVLRKYDKIPGCFKEAEIALQNLRRR